MGTFEKKRDIYFSLCAVMFSAFLLLNALSYAAESAAFPVFLTSLMVFFAVILLIKSILTSPIQEDDQAARAQYKGLVRCAFGVIGSTCLYVAGIVYVGYFVSTAVFFLSVMLLYGKNKLFPSLLATTSFLVIIYALFVYFLGIHLPQSLLI